MEDLNIKRDQVLLESLVSKYGKSDVLKYINRLNEAYTSDFFNKNHVNSIKGKDRKQLRYSIKKWLNEHNVKNYIINQDCEVDVNGEVCLYGMGLTEIPVKFNRVDGTFNCANNKLTTLEGCPNIINGYFNCGFNNLKSLKGCPRELNGDVFMGFNQLSSLKGCPSIINGFLNCSHNQLTSLEGCPSIIRGKFSCAYNPLSPEWTEERFRNICDVEDKIIGLKENEIYESFENTFDSSLVDYSKDFEDNDKKYLTVIGFKEYMEETGAEDLNDNLRYNCPAKYNVDWEWLYNKNPNYSEFRKLEEEFGNWCEKYLRSTKAFKESVHYYIINEISSEENKAGDYELGNKDEELLISKYFNISDLSLLRKTYDEFIKEHIYDRHTFRHMYIEV